MIPLFLRRVAWVALLLLALGFVAWTAAVRVDRIGYVNSVGRESAATPADAVRRQLIVPEHIAASYEWIAQTQHQLETGEIRVRHTADENAPHGRAVHRPSPYRWWLAALARWQQGDADRPAGAAVERAALWADPLLQAILLVTVAGAIAWGFGSVAACLGIVAMVTLFPLGAGFVPGAPDDFALAVALVPGALLPLLISLHRGGQVGGNGAAATTAGVAARGGFVAAGIFSGLGLWISPALHVPLILGIGFGGLLVAWTTRRRNAPVAEPGPAWRAWGLAGAATVLVTYLIEFFPAHLGGWELRVIHPVYGLAWMGGAEVLARSNRWIRDGRRPQVLAEWLALGLGVAGLLSLPLAMGWSKSMAFLSVDLLAFRLTKQTDGVLAPTLWSWLGRDGFNATAAAVLLPTLIVALLVGVAVRRTTPRTLRTLAALALGPVLVALLLATFHLRWWQALDGLLVATLPVVLAALRTERLAPRVIGFASAALALSFGLMQVLPLKELRGRNVLSLPEVEGLVERDLAHSLARRLNDPRDAIVHAPPSVSVALNYYGGLRGLSSLSWENRAGLSVALRVVVSTSREEAHALVLSRGVTHVVVASWDPFFDSYIDAASIQSGELFMNSLRRWVVPLWLRPIPYQLPTIRGFENQSVTVFEVVDEQEPAIAMSRTAEYFVEMAQLDAARAAAETLRRYPADFSALIARAQVESALNDVTAFAATLETITQRLRARADRLLPWDRRVSLAVVLARGQRADLARPQVERCLEQLDATRLRSLTPHALFHLLYLARALELEFPDPALRELGLSLLPASSRAQL